MRLMILPAYCAYGSLVGTLFYYTGLTTTATAVIVSIVIGVAGCIVDATIRVTWEYVQGRLANRRAKEG